MDDLLDLLKAKGDMSQAEYNKLKAREREEAKKNDEKLQAAEARANAAEARARAAEGRAREQQAKARAQSDHPLQVKSSTQPQTKGHAQENAQGQDITQTPSAVEASNNTQTLAEAEAIARKTLTAADLPVPNAKTPVEYVTVLPNCVGVRVATVDICIKGDLAFFGVEQFPDKSATPALVSGGLATADRTNSDSIRAGLLPSSIQLDMKTHQEGIDLGVYLGVYSGGNNIGVDAPFNANSPGSPVSFGTPGIDLRQFYGTLGTPTFGAVKAGRDIGLFGSDAVFNDLTLFGVGTPVANFAPGATSLGRIGVGYIFADWIPQIIYTTPNWNGFTASGGIFTPYNETSAFSADPLQSGTMTGHDAPEVQGQLKYVTGSAPTGKITLSADGLWQRQIADCPTGSSCLSNGTGLMTPEQEVNAWAADGFGMLDIAGFNFVAYGYIGKGVGTTGIFFQGVDTAGDPRKSYGGYLQGAYTFGRTTVGGSYGVSYLNTANAFDAANVTALCLAGTECLVHKNESWIGLVRYKLTSWVNLQAEYIHTRDQNTIGQTNSDNAVVAGTTFFW
jgi:hypothetical protein